MKWWYVVGLGICGIVAYGAYRFIQFDMHRPLIEFVAKNYSYPLRIAEIGVFWGTNAHRMFDKLDVETMYLIDPYEKYDGYSEEKFIFPFLPTSFEPVLKYLNDDRIVPLQMTSEDAVDFIPNDLDMVYIDGNHAYEYVKKDIELYYPKVKSGGIIGGHDIGGCKMSMDIQRAVFEFVNKYNLQLYIEEPDWWILK